VVAALLVAFAVGVFVTAAGSVATQRPGTPEPTRIVQVGSGDTLWGIASELADGGDVRSMMERDQAAQRARLQALQAGQRLVVPAELDHRLRQPPRPRLAGRGRQGRSRRLRPCGMCGTIWVVAGYSGTPLVRKLGIKDDHVVLLDGAPAGFELGAPRWRTRCRRAASTVDVTLTFHTSYAALARRLPTLFERTPTAGWSGSAGPRRPPRRP
jgi:hypothetical protein